MIVTEILHYMQLVRNTERPVLVEWMKRIKNAENEATEVAIDQLLSAGKLRAEHREVAIRLSDPGLTEDQVKARQEYDELNREYRHKEPDLDLALADPDAPVCPTRTVQQLFVVA